MARSRAVRLWAVSSDSNFLPRTGQGIDGEGVGLLRAGARLRQSLTASVTTRWRAGLSSFSIPAGAWKWEMVARACSMVAMERPTANQVAQVEGHSVWGVGGVFGGRWRQPTFGTVVR